MTITIGWWALPALVTVAMILVATLEVRFSPTDLGDTAAATAIALLLSCPAWLIWALWGRG